MPTIPIPPPLEGANAIPVECQSIITRLTVELSQLQAQLQQCQQDHLPNLVAKTFQLRRDNAAKELWVAAIVANSGNVECSQNF